MSTNLDRLDNAFSDLWHFFVPPVVNAAVILAIFPSIPTKIWEYSVVIINKISAGTFEKTQAFDPIIKNLENFWKDPNIIKIISETAGAAIPSTLLMIAILIFILHQVVIISSKLVFGKLDFNEKSISRHPMIKLQLKRIVPFIPEDTFYDLPANRWEFARCANDLHERLDEYKLRRAKIVLDIEKQVKGSGVIFTNHFINCIR